MIAPSRRDAILWSALIVAWSRARAGEPDAVETTTGSGYGIDPDLMRPPVRPWPLAYDKPRRRLMGRLMDTVLPAVAGRPAPSSLGVSTFMAAWLGAPYPDQITDHRLLTPLIDQLHAQDWMRLPPKMRHEHLAAVETSAAFRRFVALTAGAYYTTTEGARLVGFIGNAPTARFLGPPPEVLARLDAAIGLIPVPEGHAGA